MSKPITLQGLRKLNIIAATLLGIQGISILVLSKNFSIPISGSYLNFNQATKALEPANAALFSISLPILIAIFLLLSSLALFINATIYRKKYDANLLKGINKSRWIEYSITASIMMVAIATLVGVYDFMSLIMIFGLVAIMNLLGLIMEIHNQTTKTTNWISYMVGCFAGVIPWLVIAFYFWLSASKGSAAPTFVYWIFASIFVLFNCFAINMYLQYKKTGKWKNYLYGERSYIILSLVAKSLLAWQVFAGTLRP